MHLEDGRFLVAHQRYDSLLNPSSDLIRVHPDFWVIALGKYIAVQLHPDFWVIALGKYIAVQLFFDYSFIREIRELKKIDIDKFREDIFTSALNLSEYKSLDEAVQLYNDFLLQLLDKHAPVIVKRFRGVKSAFWDDTCQSARRERRKAERKMKKNPDDPDLKHLHGEKCIDAEAIINNARNRFYDNLLQSHKGDARATYKVVNRLLDKEYGANKVPNDTSTANKLKTFFDTKVKTIYKNIESELEQTPQSIHQNSRAMIALSTAGCLVLKLLVLTV